MYKIQKLLSPSISIPHRESQFGICMQSFKTFSMHSYVYLICTCMLFSHKWIISAYCSETCFYFSFNIKNTFPFLLSISTIPNNGAVNFPCTHNISQDISASLPVGQIRAGPKSKYVSNFDILLTYPQKYDSFLLLLTVFEIYYFPYPGQIGILSIFSPFVNLIGEDLYFTCIYLFALICISQSMNKNN